MTDNSIFAQLSGPCLSFEISQLCPASVLSVLLCPNANPSLHTPVCLSWLPSELSTGSQGLSAATLPLPLQCLGHTQPFVLCMEIKKDDFACILVVVAYFKGVR